MKIFEVYVNGKFIERLTDKEDEYDADSLRDLLVTMGTQPPHVEVREVV